MVLIKLMVGDQLIFHEVSETKPETGMPQWLEIIMDIPSVYRPGISFYSNIHSLGIVHPATLQTLLVRFAYTYICSYLLFALLPNIYTAYLGSKDKLMMPIEAIIFEAIIDSPPTPRLHLILSSLPFSSNKILV